MSPSQRCSSVDILLHHTDRQTTTKAQRDKGKPQPHEPCSVTKHVPDVLVSVSWDKVDELGWSCQRQDFSARPLTENPGRHSGGTLQFEKERQTFFSFVLVGTKQVLRVPRL